MARSSRRSTRTTKGTPIIALHLAATASAGIATPAAAQQAPVDLGPVAERLGAEAEKIIAETGIPSFSMALVRDGEVAWTGAWGLANVGGGVPATPETYYSTGSTFKWVTATAIMQLVEAGKITLDTPLNEIVDPSLRVEGADDVTLRHLLSHHSGLQGPVAIVELWSRRAPIGLDSVLAATERTGPPGTEFRYCNECYAILGHVVEEVSGRSWDAWVADSILAPLGVDVERPSVPSPEVVERLALPYELADNRSQPVPQIRYDVYPAGDAYLRASDMARFLAAQLGDGAYRDARILEVGSAREMRRAPFEGGPYGLGIGVVEDEGRELVSHSGAIPGFVSVIVGDPASGHGAYVMSNVGARLGGAPATALARLAMALLRGEEPEPLPGFAQEEVAAVEVDPAVSRQWLGDYRLQEGFVITVGTDGERFFIQATGQGRFVATPVSDDELVIQAVGARLVFGRDEPGGPITHAVLHQAGQEMRLERVGPT